MRKKVSLMARVCESPNSILRVVAGSVGPIVQHWTAVLSTVKDPLNENLRLFLDVWKSGANKNLPQLEPVIFPHSVGIYEAPSFSVEYVANNISINGFSRLNIRILNASLEDLSASLWVNIPYVIIHSDDYVVNSKALYFFKDQCVGKDLDIIIHNVDLSVNIQLGATTSTRIKELNIAFELDNVEITLEECSWGLNKVLNAMGTRVLYDNQNFINLGFKEYFIPKANEYLCNLSVQQLMINIEDFINKGVSLESKLRNFLEVWSSGTSPLLPPLHPITVPDIDNIVYDTSVISVVYSAHGILVKGMNSFTVLTLEAAEDKLTAKVLLKLSEIIISADLYELKGRAFYVYPIDCSGYMDGILNDVEFLCSIQLGTNNASTFIETTDVQIVATNIKVNMDSCSRTITNVINAEIANLFESNQEILGTLLKDQFVPWANEFLNHLTPEQLFAFIDEVIAK